MADSMPTAWSATVSVESFLNLMSNKPKNMALAPET
jgi:hypothetical protein